MTPGQTLQNAHRPSKSKKRKTAQTVEDVDQGGEIAERRAQQIASGIEEKFFEGANQTVISVAQTQQVWNSLHNRQALQHYEQQRMKGQPLERMGRAKWWGLAGEQINTLTSVLPVRVLWKNSSTYQYQLSDPQHEELLHLCKCVRVLEPNFQRAADGQ
jgi:hypothetical protein